MPKYKTKDGPKRVHVTVTVEGHVVAWVDEQAARANVSRSRQMERMLEAAIAASSGSTPAPKKTRATERERGAAE